MTGAMLDGNHSVVRQTLLALWKAWWLTRLLRLRTDVGSLLPPVASRDDNSGDVMPEKVWGQVDAIVRPFLFWKFSKRCFYRSFCVASVLRQRGVDARLGFGLHVSGHKRRLCHCWVTVDGHALCENPDPRQTFPVPLGEWDGLVCYWLADDDKKTTGDQPNEE